MPSMQKSQRDSERTRRNIKAAYPTVAPSRQSRCISLKEGQETAFVDERLAKLDDFRVVHVEDIDGHPTDRGPANKDGPLPAEMAVPLVPAWVEELGELPADGVEPGDVRPLVAVAVQAGQGKV